MTAAAGAYRDLLHEHVGAVDARRSRLWRDVLEYVFGVLAGPAVEPYPAMTPDVWTSMRCRDGRRCHCDFCRWEESNRKRVLDWERAQSLRPQPQKPHPFGSDADVAEKLAAHARDGASAASYLGPVLDRVRDEAASGVRQARQPSASRDPAGIYHAGLRVDAWRAYVTACSRAEVRADASTAEAIHVTLAAQLGHDLDDEAKPLAKRARWAVKVELAARGLTPPPQARSMRMAKAVEARRDELTRRAG